MIEVTRGNCWIRIGALGATLRFVNLDIARGSSAKTHTTTILTCCVWKLFQALVDFHTTLLTENGYLIEFVRTLTGLVRWSFLPRLHLDSCGGAEN